MPTEAYFPTRGEKVPDWAQGLCRRCPVRAECLAAGMSEHCGVWGGFSERARRALRTRGRVATKAGTAWYDRSSRIVVVLGVGWEAVA